MSSFQAFKWAGAQRPAKQAEKLVLLALASHCGGKSTDANLCFPGQEAIVDYACCSVDTVRRALKQLERAGYIKIESAKDTNGQRLYDRYRLMFDAAPKSSQRANCKVAEERPSGSSHPANCSVAAGDAAGHGQTANCAVAHDANHRANHHANHHANCGPNLRELRELEELKGARAGACEASASPARAESWRAWKPGQTVIIKRTDWLWSRWMTHLPADQVDACDDAQAIEVSKPLPGPEARLIGVVRLAWPSDAFDVPVEVVT